jgi:hypothetical protein
LFSFIAGGSNESQVKAESLHLGRAPSSHKGDVGEPGDGGLVNAVFLEGAIEEWDGCLDHKLIRDAVGSGEAVAMEDRFDLVGIGDLGVAPVDVVADPEGVIHGEAKAGAIIIIQSANWRSGEFSSVSPEGLVEKEGGEEGGRDLKFHSIFFKLELGQRGLFHREDAKKGGLKTGESSRAGSKAENSEAQKKRTGVRRGARRSDGEVGHGALREKANSQEGNGREFGSGESFRSGTWSPENVTGITGNFFAAVLAGGLF